MRYWVNVRTGEVVKADEAPDEHYEEVPGVEFMSPAEFALPDVEIEDRSWVVSWYLKRRAEIEGRVAARKASFDAGVREDKSALLCLDYRYLDEVEHLAGELLVAQPGKKKSVNVEFGKVGWRKDTAILVTDEESVIAWCLEQDVKHAAVKTTLSVLKKQLPKGEKIPGVIWPSGDTFFARPSSGG